MSTESLMVGAGCFWGVQQRFSHIHGVDNTTVGYAGGTTENPTYQDVCHGDTMHAEVVLIEFDNKTITRQELLELFFGMHNATTLNRQGPDVGTQYRSVIFYDSEDEKLMAQQAINQAQQSSSSTIATTLEQMAPFYKAEEYHQHYFEKRGIHSGCH